MGISTTLQERSRVLRPPHLTRHRPAQAALPVQRRRLHSIWLRGRKRNFAEPGGIERRHPAQQPIRYHTQDVAVVHVWPCDKHLHSHSMKMSRFSPPTWGARLTSAQTFPAPPASTAEGP